MKQFLLMALGVMLITNDASADQYGRPAYPDYWYGGPPLPPLGHAQPMYSDGYSYRPSYSYTPSYSHPTTTYAPQTRVTVTTTIRVHQTTGWNGTSANCIVSNLYGTHWQDGCEKLNLTPSEAAYLRGIYLR